MVHLGTVLACGGLLILMHAGYSVEHFKQFRVGEEVGRDSAPMDACLEALVGFFVCVVGVLWSAGSFLPIKGAAGGGKSLDSAESTQGFDGFHHRGKSLRVRGAP
ncbi:unnamed protein product [Choristocarpus tenellus]